jgi:hypothetical protein
MLIFKDLTLQDFSVIEPYFHSQCSRICDDTPGVAVMWRDYFHIGYAVSGGSLILRLRFASGITAFEMPLGGDESTALAELECYCRAAGLPLVFCNVPDCSLPLLRSRYPAAFIQPSRDWSDYLYLTEDLLNFKGKKYDGQRNHIHRFQKLYPGYRFCEITADNLARVQEFYREFREENEKESELARAESAMVAEVLQNYAAYRQFGGFLEAEGNVVAFSIGERVNDTVYVHIEKADTRYMGVYQVIVQEFLRQFARPGDLYVNREEDVGDEGLRRSKLSYHPAELLTKSTVIAGAPFDGAEKA